MAEDGCITDFRANNFECNKLLIKNNTNDLFSTDTSKGDILVGTNTNTITRLPVGINNYVLAADSSSSTGLKWRAETGGGGGGGSTTLP